MKRYLMYALIALSLTLSGCALMNKAFPNQVDASGNIISGTHTANAAEQAAAGVLPWGSVALNGILLVWNGIEQFQKKKIGKGLTATLTALNQVKDDPNLKAQWEAVQEILSNTHKAAGVQALINKELATL